MKFSLLSILNRYVCCVLYASDPCVFVCGCMGRMMKIFFQRFQIWFVCYNQNFKFFFVCEKYENLCSWLVVLMFWCGFSRFFSFGADCHWQAKNQVNEMYHHASKRLTFRFWLQNFSLFFAVFEANVNINLVRWFESVIFLVQYSFNELVSASNHDNHIAFAEIVWKIFSLSMKMKWWRFFRVFTLIFDLKWL